MWCYGCIIQLLVALVAMYPSCIKTHLAKSPWQLNIVRKDASEVLHPGNSPCILVQFNWSVCRMAWMHLWSTFLPNWTSGLQAAAMFIFTLQLFSLIGKILVSLEMYLMLCPSKSAQSSIQTIHAKQTRAWNQQAINTMSMYLSPVSLSYPKALQPELSLSVNRTECLQTN